MVARNDGLGESRDSVADLAEVRTRAGNPGFFLVDVLPAASYAQGHIPRAMNLPLADIPGRALTLVPDLDADIVAYCGGPT